MVPQYMCCDTPQLLEKVQWLLLVSYTWELGHRKVIRKINEATEVTFVYKQNYHWNGLELIILFMVHNCVFQLDATYALISFNKSAGLVSIFVNTTKIFWKLSGTLCQFNCLETLIFFKKLSTIRILFCSNDKCALHIILKN